MSARTLLFWVDLESTGLDVRKGHGLLLEFATVVTDLQLNELWSDGGLIPHKMEDIDRLLQDKAREMHEANGLLEEMRSIQDTQWCYGEEAVKFTEDQLIARLNTYASQEPTIFIIAGSSISFDRAALKEHMPRLEKMLHYRQLDVSVYKVGFPHIFGEGTSTAHRAMADIRESIKKHAKMRKIVEIGTGADSEQIGV